MTLDKASIIDGFSLSFDPGDPANGSLYIGTLGQAGADAGHEAIIDRLRGVALWSDTTPKQVADDQREAYKAGLDFVEAIAFDDDGPGFIIARFDHPEYPSSAERWQAWQASLDAVYRRS